MYIGLGIVLLVIGAILAFALKIDIPGVGDDHSRLHPDDRRRARDRPVLLATRRRPVGYTTTRESQVDPASGSRVDRTDVDPR